MKGLLASLWICFCFICFTGALMPDTSLECGDTIRITVNPFTKSGLKALSDNLQVGPHPWCVNGQGTATPQPECQLKKSSELGSYFEFEAGKCNPRVEEDDMYSKHTYLVYTAPIKSASIFQRFDCNYKPFVCKFKRFKTVSAKEEVHSKEMKMVMQGKTQKSGYGVEFKFKSADYQDDVNPPEYKLNEYVFVEIGSDHDITITAKECTAHAEKKLSDASISKYPIIKEGCPAMNPGDDSDAIEITNNTAAKVQFKFKSFVWREKGKNRIYLTCKFHVCDKILPDCVSPTFDCSGSWRRRRGIESGGSDSESSEIIHVSTPITIVKPEDPCLESPCQDMCTNNEGKAVCQCYPGRTLQQDEVSCVDIAPLKTVEVETIQLQTATKTFSFEWILFYIYILVTLVVFLAVIFLQRRKGISYQKE